LADDDDLPPGVLARLRIVLSPAELAAQARYEAKLAAETEDEPVEDDGG
jgi:hypothetical protein